MQVRQAVPKPVRKAQVQKEDLDAKEYQEIQAMVIFLRHHGLILFVEQNKKFTFCGSG